MKIFSFYQGASAIIALLLIGACTHSPDDTVNPGGPNDPPPVDTIACDSTNVTYPETVYPILQANCISCHGGATPSGGLNFTNYDHVAFVAESGQLLGSIRHLAGFQPMPQGGPKLSECEIALIAKWVNDTTFNPGGNNGNCDPDTVYFQNDVLPLLMSSCGIAGCHDEQSAQEDIILTSYFHVMQSDVVKPFDPDDSEMYEKITEDDPDKRMPPPPALPLNADQQDLIYKWIAQGALNNQCDEGDCDTLNVTFSGTIFPIIQNNCYGCHSGPAPQSGLNLENYVAISAAAAIPPGNPGSLLGTVTWAQGNVPMPDKGPQLPACDILHIQKWIADGMPDN
jgi:mono/diheme cytochrome c family protein